MCSKWTCIERLELPSCEADRRRYLIVTVLSGSWHLSQALSDGPWSSPQTLNTSYLLRGTPDLVMLFRPSLYKYYNIHSDATQKLTDEAWRLGRMWIRNPQKAQCRRRKLIRYTSTGLAINHSYRGNVRAFRHSLA